MGDFREDRRVRAELVGKNLAFYLGAAEEPFAVVTRGAALGTWHAMRGEELRLGAELVVEVQGRYETAVAALPPEALKPPTGEPPAELLRGEALAHRFAELLQQQSDRVEVDSRGTRAVFEPAEHRELSLHVEPENELGEQYYITAVDQTEDHEFELTFWGADPLGAASGAVGFAFESAARLAVELHVPVPVSLTERCCCGAALGDHECPGSSRGAGGPAEVRGIREARAAGLEEDPESFDLQAGGLGMTMAETFAAYPEQAAAAAAAPTSWREGPPPEACGCAFERQDNDGLVAGDDRTRAELGEWDGAGTLYSMRGVYDGWPVVRLRGGGTRPARFIEVFVEDLLETDEFPFDVGLGERSDAETCTKCGLPTTGDGELCDAGPRCAEREAARDAAVSEAVEATRQRYEEAGTDLRPQILAPDEARAVATPQERAGFLGSGIGGVPDDDDGF